MASALDVARYLIHVAAPAEDEDLDCLSHLRLQKLLYYIQAWHLATCGKPLFNGRIEAWCHGPVVKEIYPVFRDYGFLGIPPKEGRDSESLTLKDKDFIKSVWEQYKQYSATALSKMTHEEAPWQTAREGLGPNDLGSGEITHESMREYFAPRLHDYLETDLRFDRSAWEKSGRAIKSGRVQTTQEIRREILRRRAGPDEGGD